MEEKILENILRLPAHKYPLWVKLFASAIALATLYSLILLPKYWVASKNLNAAKLAYQTGKYTDAIGFYQNVLKIVPSSKTARIGAAEVIFSNDDKSDDESGLALLEDVALDDYTWSKISKIMPVEYQKYFGVKQ
jgi:hypothetical protein